MPSQTFAYLSYRLHAAGNGSLIPASQDAEKYLQLVKGPLARALGSLFTGAQTEVLRTIRSGSRIAAPLSSVMAEQHEGQNMYISECLSGLMGDSMILESLKVALFLISNNFPIGKVAESRWSDYPGNDGSEGRSVSFEGSNSEGKHIKSDKIIMAVFDMLGFNNLQSIKQLLSVPGATARAIAQQLYASSVRTHDLKILKMLFRAGMSPLTSILHYGYPSSPLIITTEVQDSSVALEMARLLLSHNSGTRASSAGRCSFPRSTFKQSGAGETITP